MTEIVYALGERDRLVARDTTDLSASGAALPDVGYMRALSPEGVLSVEPRRDPSPWLAAARRRRSTC